MSEPTSSRGTSLRAQMAEIIQDAGEDGVELGPAEDAADKILAIPEVEAAFDALRREDSWSSIYDGDG